MVDICPSLLRCGNHITDMPQMTRTITVSCNPEAQIPDVVSMPGHYDSYNQPIFWQDVWLQQRPAADYATA